MGKLRVWWQNPVDKGAGGAGEEHPTPHLVVETRRRSLSAL